MKLKDAKLQVTINYDLFHFYPHNRPVNDKRLKGLEDSVLKHPELAMIFPIIVDSEYNIYDGQRRFTVWKKHGMPIYYRFYDELTNGRSIIHCNNAPIKWSLEEMFISYSIQFPQSAQAKLKKFIPMFEPLKQESPALKGFMVMKSLFSKAFKINIMTAIDVNESVIEEAEHFIPQFVDVVCQIGRPRGIKTTDVANAVLQLYLYEGYTLQDIRRVGNIREFSITNTQAALVLFIANIIKLKRQGA